MDEKSLLHSKSPFARLKSLQLEAGQYLVMSANVPTPPRQMSDPVQQAGVAFGRSIGAVIMVVFGFFWLGWGFSNSSLFINFSAGRARPATMWILFYCASLVFVGIAVRAVRRTRRELKALGPISGDFRSRYGKQFRLISILEGIGCGIVLLLASQFHRMDLVAAGIGVVVGLHFLPLARLFRFPAYYVTGVGIVLCDALSMLLLQGTNITLSAAIGTGSALWITAVYALYRSQEFLGSDTEHG